MFEQKFQTALQYFSVGHLDMAWRAALALLESESQHPGVLQLLGEIAWQQGNNSAAQDLFSRAVAGNPRDPQAHYRLANVLFAKHDVDAAANHYRQALCLKPNYWQASVNLGLLAPGRRSFSGSTGVFRAGARVAPGSYSGLLLSAGFAAVAGRAHCHQGNVPANTGSY